jgi:hypothetical protein
VRLFCELFLVAVLIWLGWTKSFHDRIDQIRGVEPTPAPQQAQMRQTTTAATTTTTAAAPRQPFLPASRVRPPSTPSGAWMWDPAHRNTLDRPSYKTGDASVQQAAQQSGQNYWIDGQGVRHSVNATPPPTGSP